MFGRLTSTLNLKLLRGWASQYLSGPAQSYALNCYTHGFPTRSRAPPLMDIAAPNKVQPGTPAGAAVDERLARLAERGRLISTDIPLVRGTQTLQYTHASKVKVGPDLKPKIKHRAVVNGDYPNDGTSRKAWVNPGDIAFTVLFTIVEICAFALRFDVVAASLFDYVAFFETLPRALSEIASSATFWRGKFHYSRDHVFGERATPFSANVHATVLQAAQQDWVNRVTVQLHQICRRTDDLMCMHPRADIESAPRAVEAIKLACRAARQPLQDNKEVIIAPRVLFDGLAFDFPEKALGYPAQKQLRLVFLLGRALGVSDATTISRLPSDVRNAAHALLAAHKELASVSDAPQVLRRMELESITSSLEYAVIAIVNLRSRIPPIRACWQHLKSDYALVDLSEEARVCLNLFYKLFLDVEDIWYPMANLFERPPDTALTTDASGKHGFGGHASNFFFCEPVRPAWNLHVQRLPKDLSTAWLELGALFLALHCAVPTWRNKVLLWTTDSEAAVGAWRQGRSKSPPINALLWATQRQCTKLGLCIIPRHVPRSANKEADALSNQDINKFLALSRSHRLTHHLLVTQHALNRLERTLNTRDGT